MRWVIRKLGENQKSMWRQYLKRKGVIHHVNCCLSFKLCSSGFSKVEVIHCCLILLENPLSYFRIVFKCQIPPYPQLMTCCLFQCENRERCMQPHLRLCPECACRLLHKRLSVLLTVINPSTCVRPNPFLTIHEYGLGNTPFHCDYFLHMLLFPPAFIFLEVSLLFRWICTS